MIRFAFVPVLLALSLFGWNPDEQPNVNSRYTVESVHVSGRRTTRLSQSTRHELERVVGQKLDHSLLDQIATRIKKELRVEGVAVHVAKGSKPEQVSVDFTVEGGRRQDFDLEMPKGVYHSRQGWSGGINATTNVSGNRLGLGVISDGDTQVQRFAGVRASFERNAPSTERLRFRFDLESYHEWNNLASANYASTYDNANSHFAPDLYRSRQNFQPSMTFIVAQPLSITVGVSVQRLVPETAALETATSAAVIGTLRYHQRWKNGSADEQLDGTYAMRSGTELLGSNFAFTRQSWNLGYKVERGRNALATEFIAGRMTGQAPLYERFVLGNSTTLRGYNKYDLDPLGGNRMVHGSLEYSYRRFQAFYDVGTIWINDKTSTGTKQSAGVGYGRAGRDGFMIALAFPLRGGHVEPMLIAGFNF